MGRIKSSPAEFADPDAQTQPPQVFVRTFTAPSGLPWEQARAAQLDARHGAPLPLGDLLHRVKRLQTWSPGASGRYAFFYVRRRDYTGAFQTTVEVDGQLVQIAFGGGPDLARARRMAGVAAIAAAAAAMGGGAISVAYLARADAEARMAALEQQVTARKRQADRYVSEQERIARLAAAKGELGLPVDVLSDLAWLSRARAPDARIVAVHWERGLIAVESRGPETPVATTERALVRSRAPIRRGVWLWGINDEARAAKAAPVSAEFSQ